MDIRQEASDMIKKIRNETCMKCPKGKFLVALGGLIDSLDDNGTGEQKIVQDKPKAKKARRAPAGLKTKAPRKSSPPASGNGYQQQIRDFLKLHPESSTAAIAKAIKTTPYIARYTMKKMGREITHSGSTSASVWSLAGSKPSQSKQKFQQPGVQLNFTCEACRARFLTKEQLDGHNQAHHGGKAAKAARYECEECERFFASMDELETHVQAVHED